MKEYNPEELDALDLLFEEIELSINLKVSIQNYFLQKGGGSILVPINNQGESYSDLVDINDECFEEAEPIVKIVLEELEEFKKETKINVQERNKILDALLTGQYSDISQEEKLKMAYNAGSQSIINKL